ncbi:hypothetical protein TRFO_01048 [Tritrichomonas foetus]|uniref:Leucine Rich Repeat family protein n=1 Tax=Tritrichomonas foetus TaxID=1144522 RepID=A0A1J4KIG0_9EUKA|nr:hypothetical protein TRFO_01048 [Tritrichomonas foetus]|eukprot:OHT11153.1 hypothetical protein TRFO_01048 [Tritrichomonas foetus]
MSDQALKESLSNLDPIFNLKNLKIIAHEEIEEISPAKKKDKYNLVITNAGIFLFSVKKFRKPVSLVGSLSFIDITSIHISQQTVSFLSPIASIRFSSKNAQNIGFLVYFIRQILFPMSLAPISLNLDQGIQFRFDQTSFPYKDNNIFRDRFLSCIMKLRPPILSPDIKFDSISNNGVFSITKEMMDDPLLQSLLLSLAFEDQVTELELNNVILQQLFRYCETLFRLNKFIKRVVFISPDFTNSGLVLEKILSTGNLFKPTEWVFKYCSFYNVEIFNSLAKIGCEFLSFQFVHCSFDTKSIYTLFNIIISNHACFHSIQNLFFSDIRNKCGLSKAVSQLCEKEWINSTQSLNKISLVNCDIEVSYLLCNFLSNETGVNRLIFKQCRFNKKIQEFSVQQFKLKELNLEKCSFTHNSLLSLFGFLMSELVSVSNLNLSFLNIDKEGFDLFINQIDDFIIPSLKVFSFNANTMKSSQLAHFNKFLSKQRKLSALYLNGSITITDGKESLKELLDIIVSNDITRIGLRGAGTYNFSFGAHLTKFLLLLGQKGTIQSLDISYQYLTKECISALIILINTSPIQELYFDGICVPNFECLFDLCEEIMRSSLEYTVWPYEECERLFLSYDNPELIEKVKSTIDKFQNSFQAKFTNKPTYAGYKKSIDSKVYKKRNIKLEYFDPIKISERSEEIDNLYKESVDTDKQFYYDPVLLALEQYEKNISFDRLRKITKRSAC